MWLNTEREQNHSFKKLDWKIPNLWQGEVIFLIKLSRYQDPQWQFIRGAILSSQWIRLNRLNLQIFFQIFCAFIRSDRAVSGQVWRTFHVLWTNKWKRTTSKRRKHTFSQSNSDSFQFMVSRHSQLYVDVCTVCFGHPDFSSYLFGQASVSQAGKNGFSSIRNLPKTSLLLGRTTPQPSCWTRQVEGPFAFFFNSTRWNISKIQRALLFSK